MRPLSTRVIESDATYEEIIASADRHKDLKAMKKCVMEENVIFFMYRGCEDKAIIMMCMGEFFMSVCDCPKVTRMKTNPDFLYALSYGV